MFFKNILDKNAFTNLRAHQLLVLLVFFKNQIKTKLEIVRN